jgi:hypothetical protein
MQDSKEITTIVCMFWGLRNSISLSGRLHLETGREKFKMAAAKPKYQYLSFCTRYKEIQTANPMFSGSGNSMVLSLMLHYETGSEKINIAAAKPKVIYLSFYTIEQRNSNV